MSILIDQFSSLDPEGYCDNILESSIESAIAEFKRFYEEYNEAQKVNIIQQYYHIISTEEYKRIKQKWLIRERQVHFRLFRSVLGNDLC
jgi:aminoglycoside N3'-acetyltransferase